MKHKGLRNDGGQLFWHLLQLRLRCKGLDGVQVYGYISNTRIKFLLVLNEQASREDEIRLVRSQQQCCTPSADRLHGPQQPSVSLLLLCKCLLCPLNQHGLKPYFCSCHWSVTCCDASTCSAHSWSPGCHHAPLQRQHLQLVACNADLSALPCRLCGCNLQSLLHNGHREPQTLLSRLQVHHALLPLRLLNLHDYRPSTASASLAQSRH